MNEPTPEIVEQVVTAAGRDTTSTPNRPAGTDDHIPPQLRAFIEQAFNGQLPDLSEMPALDPQVVAIARELQIVHLPEWRNPAGRKLADASVAQIKPAIRIAEYLFRRGIRLHPEHEQIRWIPTPNGPPRAYDQGLHITPDEHGQWPAVDPEQFWDVAEIAVQQNNNGDWTAMHPRGLEFTAPKKSEAYAGLVDRLRTKIEEAQT